MADVRAVVVNFPPDHCPYCGAALEPFDEPRVYGCTACDRWVFHNPVPSARVLVLDGERFLLVRQGVEPVEGLWLTPGGKVVVGRGPAECAAVELEEETGLSVDPDDLVLCDARAAESPEDHYVLSLCYAVDYAATSGTLEAGSDAAEARFWTPSELAAAAREDSPEWVGFPEDRLHAARRALDRTG